jgi:VCBS repeat-containing protein
MPTLALRRCLAWSARAAGVALILAAFGVVADAPGGPTPDPARPVLSVKPSQGYWLLAADGGIFSYGAATYYGPNRNLGRDIAAMARTPDGAGFWTVDDDGDVFHYGNAAYYGSRLIHPDDIAGFAARPQADGYWMVTRDGVVWKFGNAPNLSPPTPLRPNKPIVGMAATPSGLGYWLVAIDGGIFSFGDAAFYGSTGGINLNKPIVGMTSTGTGAGYWMVATDGGIFAFGDATFYGSTGGSTLNQPIVGMAAMPPIRTNTVPAAADDSAGLAEDSSVVVDVLANDAGLTDGGLGVAVVGPPGHGAATVTPDGRIAYRPATNWFGTDAVSYRVADVDGDAATATVRFTVAPVNDAPVAPDRSLSILEDLPGTGIVTATDVDSADLAYVLTGQAAHGTATVGTVNGVGAFTYSPAPNYNGSDSFVVAVGDGQGGIDTAVVSVTATPVNDAPVVLDQVLGTSEDSPISRSVAATDDDGDLLSYGIASGPAHGTASVITTSGVFTYTPAANYTGPDSFTVTVSDGHGGTDTATISITVTPANDPPTISAIADSVVNEDSAVGSLSFIVADTETTATSLTVTGASSQTSIVANSGITVGGSGPNRTVTVTPVGNASGTTTITLTVSDGTATSSEAFTVTVVPVNDPPTISAVADRSTNEDSSTGAISFTIGDVETPASFLALTGTSSNQTVVAGSAIAFGGFGSARNVTVTPLPDANGTTSMTVTVSDGQASASEAFTLTVNAVNDAPVVSPIADTTIDEDNATGPIGFTLGDVETPTVSLTVSGSSSNQALVPNSAIVFAGSAGSRTVTVTPTANASGTATITVAVSDGIGTSSEAFLLTVNVVNDLPTISAIADLSTAEDTPTAAIAFVIGDVETPAASLTVAGASSDQSLVADGGIVVGGSGSSRTVTVTPVPNAAGTATITVSVSDGTATVTELSVLTVNPVNDGPTISAIGEVSIPLGTSTGFLAFTVGDVETNPADLTVTATSDNPAVVPDDELALLLAGTGSDRTLLVTPDPLATGTATITVTVSDGTTTAQTAFVLTVS